MAPNSGFYIAASALASLLWPPLSHGRMMYHTLLDQRVKTRRDAYVRCA